MKGYKQISVKGMIMVLLVIASIVAIRNGMINSTKWYLILVATVPMVVIGLNYNKRKDNQQAK